MDAKQSINSIMASHTATSDQLNLEELGLLGKIELILADQETLEGRWQ